MSLAMLRRRPVLSATTAFQVAEDGDLLVNAKQSTLFMMLQAAMMKGNHA